jgi:phosphopantetheinyl transferase
MDFPFQNCLIPVDDLSVHRVRNLLHYRHGLQYIILDLLKLHEEMLQTAKKQDMALSLSGHEQEYLNTFRSEKRKKEWLGGRFAAKYAVAEMLGLDGKDYPWSKLAVSADENGRPFLAAGNGNETVPDISISHSGNLAAALAVSKGLCGIDIQKVTDRVIKVRERFCSPSELDIFQSYFGAGSEKNNALLTGLWAAKEALRKVANSKSLPGFLALKLSEIDAPPSDTYAPAWRFTFIWRHPEMGGNAIIVKCIVAVSLLADYALALTTRNDTVA